MASIETRGIINDLPFSMAGGGLDWGKPTIPFEPPHKRSEPLVPSPLPEGTPKTPDIPAPNIPIQVPQEPVPAGR